MPKTRLQQTEGPLNQPTSPARPGRRALLAKGLAAACGALLLPGCGGGAAGDPGDGPADAAGVDDGVKRPLGGVDGGGTGSPARMAYLSASVQTTVPLVVGGVELDTSGSDIGDAEGQALLAHELLPGMGVQVEADALRPNTMPPQAAARRITVGAALRGPVAEVDLAGNRFTLLGQRVAVNNATVWGAGLSDGLAALAEGAAQGRLVQVHGPLDTAAGSTVATRIDLTDGTSPWLVRGVLSRLDRAQGEAFLGGLALQLGAGLLATLDSALAAGSLVRAQLQPATTAGALIVQAMRDDALKLPDAVQAHIEGRVTRVDSANRFAIDGVIVQVSASTAFANARWLAPGVQASAEGVSANGVLMATEVEVQADQPVELQGSISQSDWRSQRFVLKGVTVAWSSATAFEGGPARLLSVRRRVAVLGHWNADRSVLQALHIHIEA